MNRHPVVKRCSALLSHIRQLAGEAGKLETTPRVHNRIPATFQESLLSCFKCRLPCAFGQQGLGRLFWACLFTTFNEFLFLQLL
jgi:hypothetical protein